MECDLDKLVVSRSPFSYIATQSDIESIYVGSNCDKRELYMFHIHVPHPMTRATLQLQLHLTQVWVDDDVENFLETTKKHTNFKFCQI